MSVRTFRYSPAPHPQVKMPPSHRSTKEPRLHQHKRKTIFSHLVAVPEGSCLQTRHRGAQLRCSYAFTASSGELRSAAPCGCQLKSNILGKEKWQSSVVIIIRTAAAEGQQTKPSTDSKVQQWQLIKASKTPQTQTGIKTLSEAKSKLRIGRRGSISVSTTRRTKCGGSGGRNLAES